MVWAIEKQGFSSQWGQKIFLFSAVSSVWHWGSLSLLSDEYYGLHFPRGEAAQDVKYKGQEFTDAWSYTSTSLCIFMA
jgi:hypothetical protein